MLQVGGNDVTQKKNFWLFQDTLRPVPSNFCHSRYPFSESFNLPTSHLAPRHHDRKFWTWSVTLGDQCSRHLLPSYESASSHPSPAFSQPEYALAENVHIPAETNHWRSPAPSDLSYQPSPSPSPSPSPQPKSPHSPSPPPRSYQKAP